jgi:hypothetical protein
MILKLAVTVGFLSEVVQDLTWLSKLNLVLKKGVFVNYDPCFCMTVPLMGSYAGIEAGYGLKLRALLGNILLLHKKCLHLNLFLNNTFTCAMNY